MTGALVVAAHGSHYNPGTALPAWACVDAIRQTRLFDEVTAAFWKEQPSFGTVLESLTANEIIIVPLFTSEGYFSQVVLPAELNPRPGQRIQIMRTAGLHEYFVPIVTRRIESAVEAETKGLKSKRITVVVVGHGTPRHADSSSTTEYQADLLRQTGRFGEVITAYLDEAPYIQDIYEAAAYETLVVVPFFIAEGLHTQDDIPEALGLQKPFYTPQILHQRTVIYTPPVGLEADLYKVVLALAGENPEAPLIGSLWDSIPLPHIEQADSVGEVWLGNPAYVCHITDRHTPAENLTRLETPDEIRAMLRFTDAGIYRPLTTAKNLPTGWCIPIFDNTLAILETIYPGLTPAGKPRSVRQVGARQKGKYRAIRELSLNAISELRQRVCGNCVRCPVWDTRSLSPLSSVSISDEKSTPPFLPPHCDGEGRGGVTSHHTGHDAVTSHHTGQDAVTSHHARQDAAAPLCMEPCSIFLEEAVLKEL